MTHSKEIDLDQVCNGVSFGTRVSAGVMIGCVEQKGKILFCEDGEIFDTFLGKCENKILTSASNENVCEHIALGLFPMDDENEYFIACENSVAFVRKCPESSYFDHEIDSCVEDFEYFKKTTTYKTTTIKASKKTTTKRPTHSTTVEDTTTTKKYTAPTVPDVPSVPSIPTRPTYSTTVEDTTTSKKYTAPTIPDVPSVPSIPTRPTYSTTTQTPSTTTKRDVVISFDCPLSGYGNIPNAIDCTRYYECIKGVGHPRSCPPSTIFDVITKECGNPENSLCADRIRCY